MDRESRNAALAATLILGGFGLAAFFLPRVMIAVGNVSTIAAGAVGIGFVALFFLVFWLRGRSRREKGN